MARRSLRRFLLYGLMVAGPEEMLTQAVVPGSWRGLFAVVAFVPYLLVAWAFAKLCERLLGERSAGLAYYLGVGALGLLTEWLVIGLAPWKDPGSPAVLLAVFHLGMFSFWATVAMAPLLLTDPRAALAALQRGFLRAYFGMMAGAWLLAVGAKLVTKAPGPRFLFGFAPVVVLFLGLNVYHVRYVRSLGKNRLAVAQVAALSSSSDTP